MFQNPGLRKALAFVGACALLALWPAHASAAPSVDTDEVPWVDNDFNGDGKADITFRNTDTGSTVIWLMDGLRVIEKRLVAAPPTRWVLQ